MFRCSTEHYWEHISLIGHKIESLQLSGWIYSLSIEIIFEGQMIFSKESIFCRISSYFKIIIWNKPWPLDDANNPFWSAPYKHVLPERIYIYSLCVLHITLAYLNYSTSMLLHLGSTQTCQSESTLFALFEGKPRYTIYTHIWSKFDVFFVNILLEY